MKYRDMEESDLESVIEIYMKYYNNHEDGCWTYETTYKRIHEIWSRESSYCVIVEDDEILVGFILGYFRQYDDVLAYDLDEIVVDADYQNKGIGTAIMIEIEQRIKSEGASMIELQAVNDDMHEYFYGRLQYKNANNFVLKSKWL